MVSEYVVLAEEATYDLVGADIAATMLLDVGSTLRRKYGIGRDAMLLIRPDGYLALRHDEWSPQHLRSHLEKWLVPTESTLLEEL